MTWRRVVASACGALLACAVSWAAVCPLCLQQIPDGEKYCARHKAEMLAQTLAVGDEQKLADDVMRARADYEAKLAPLDADYAAKLAPLDADLAALHLSEYPDTAWNGRSIFA